MKNLMNFDYQVESEKYTELNTHLNLQKWILIYPNILDTLFQVAYFIGEAENETSPQGHFQSLGYQNLVQFPYTVRATCILIEKGFYSEAIILVRNLYESFFQLRYFCEHKDKIADYWQKKKRIQIKTIFEEIAPDFYSKIYAREFSEFAHAGLGSSMFRSKYFPTEIRETKAGSNYDQDGSTYSIHKLIVVAYGILNYIPIFFSQYLNLVEDKIENKRKEVLIQLESIMKDHLLEKPESKEFYDLVHPLIHII